MPAPHPACRFESRSVQTSGSYPTLLSANEAARLHETIEYFRGGSSHGGKPPAARSSKSRVRRVEKTLRSDKIVALTGRLSAFVEADAPASDIYVHLIPLRGKI